MTPHSPATSFMRLSTTEIPHLHEPKALSLRTRAHKALWKQGHSGVWRRSAGTVARGLRALAFKVSGFSLRRGHFLGSRRAYRASGSCFHLRLPITIVLMLSLIQFGASHARTSSLVSQDKSLARALFAGYYRGLGICQD